MQPGFGRKSTAAVLMALMLAGCGDDAQQEAEPPPKAEESGTAAGGPEAPAVSADETSLETVKREFGDAMDALAGFTAEQRGQAVDKARRLLSDLDGDLAVLQARMRARINEMDGTTRDQLRDALENLKTRRDAVHAALTHMDSESAQAAWSELKSGFAASYAALMAAVAEARAAYAEAKEQGAGSDDSTDDEPTGERPDEPADG